MGKMINWELCKRLKFDHTNEWYMLKLESVFENKTHKILGDFEIQMDHSILARRPDLVFIRKDLFLRFCCSSGPQSKNERMQKDRQVFGYCQRAEKAMEHGNETNFS